MVQSVLRSVVSVFGILGLCGIAVCAAPFEKVSKKKRAAPPEVYDNGAGISVGAGMYNGFVMKRRVMNDDFMQGMVGFRMFTGQLILNADYYREFHNLMPIMNDIDFYGGAGLTLVFADQFESLLSTQDKNAAYYGIRVPLGGILPLKLFELPFDVFAEVVPGILVVPFGPVFLGMSLGMRYLY